MNPHAWLADTLTKLVNRWPASRIDELMPWAYAKIAPGRCLNGQRAVRAPLTAKAVSVAVQRIVRRLRNSAQEHSHEAIAWSARYLAEAWCGARNRVGMYRILAATSICAVVPGASGCVTMVVAKQGPEWKFLHFHRSAMPR